MDIRTIKLCPLYEYCPRMQCYDDEQIYADNEPFIYLNSHPCLIKKLGQRKSHICMMQIDLSKTTLENALKDVLKRRKKYTKYYYASDVDDYINRLKEMIKNDGRSSWKS